MLFKQEHSWVHHFALPWLRPKHWWERYEEVLIIAAAIILVTLLGFLLRFSIVPQAVTEQLYISPLSYSYEADFFVPKETANPKHPFTLLEHFDTLDPFTTLGAATFVSELSATQPGNFEVAMQ